MNRMTSTSFGLFVTAAVALGTSIVLWNRRNSPKETRRKSDDRHAKATQTDLVEASGQLRGLLPSPPPPPPPTPQPATETSKETSVSLVVQRFRQASLLVDGQVVSVGESCDMIDPPSEHDSDITSSSSSLSCGLLVYISFAKSATSEKALQAAKTVVNLPLMTQGSWGDGLSTKSVLDMAMSNTKPYLLLVPQANLISRVRSQGKSIQYHGQIDKEVGKQLYHEFLDYTRALVLECQYQTRKEPVPKWVSTMLSGTKKSIDISLPPQEMFRDLTLYSVWDADGIPTKDVNHEDLTRSALKKLKKQHETQKKRYEKYLKTASTVSSEDQLGSKQNWTLLDKDFCTIVGGTFGGRQGLLLSSDMGPFCHVLSL